MAIFVYFNFCTSHVNYCCWKQVEKGLNILLWWLSAVGMSISGLNSSSVFLAAQFNRKRAFRELLWWSGTSGLLSHFTLRSVCFRCPMELKVDLKIRAGSSFSAPLRKPGFNRHLQDLFFQVSFLITP